MEHVKPFAVKFWQGKSCLSCPKISLMSGRWKDCRWRWQQWRLPTFF